MWTIRLRVRPAVFCMLGWQALAGPARAQEPARWRLQPELPIGREQPAEYALTATRVLAVADDGTMYLVQPRDFTIRVFDVAGRFLCYVGRPGPVVHPVRDRAHRLGSRAG